jgi:small subunit ribosomal protein S5
MTAKDLKTNMAGEAAPEAAALNVKIPATGVDAEVVVAKEDGVLAAAPVPSEAGKVTMGKRMRDNARRGGRGGAPGAGGQRGGRSPRPGEPRERIKPEFDSKIIDIRRVTRVTAGGRRMNFSVAVVAGDRKGRVGVGLGKGSDTASAVEKATREAKKNLIKIPLTPQGVIPHATEAKLGSAMIKIFPAKGSGVVAGSSARAVIELAGIKDVCAKFLSGSKNRLNNAKVTIEALNRLVKIPREKLAGKKE